MYIISIDVGTTNTKVCLYQLPDFQLAEVVKFATPQLVKGTETDLDAEQLWGNILKALQKLSDAVKDAQQIKQITVSSFGQAIVLQDRQEKVIPPTIAWFDPRTKAEAQEAKEILGEERIYEVTGINSHSNHSLTKLLWLKRHENTAFKRMHAWTCMSGFIASRLTGVFATDWSLASRTMLFDITKKTWDNKFIEMFELDVETFPHVVESGARVANIKESISEKTGLPKHVTVSIAGHDHMAGSISTGLQKQTEILNSTGTTEGLLLLADKPNLSNEFRKFLISNGCYVLESTYSIYGSMPTAGQSFSWISKIFNKEITDTGRLCDEIYQEYAFSFGSMVERMQVFIPHLRGSGPPIRSTSSKVMIYGLTDQSTDDDILFSMIAGLCFELKQLKGVYEQYLNSKINRIKVIGPAVKNPLWLQLKADILQAEIIAYEEEEAVAKGAAILSSRKQGLMETLPEAKIKTYTPKEERVQILQDFYQNVYVPVYNLKNHLEGKG
ncbi:FGGY-family carbohydrate kinase [Oceanobacillus neutriphilus]|uniref:Carbohydrate kinase n=1 Tax=Oceanobacillus neutriphilus TaxID=531815 RepID=A0ABQ2NX91_9BACI|nr:FGGY family carbohydrate kinase [Oceanobacillus neutriphilus]GGP12835.1 carbohydrate kinase [Oceanobacillus neutriphilus]